MFIVGEAPFRVPRPYIAACGNDADRVLRSVIAHVVIANPAFVPDARRIQEDHVAGPAQGPH